MIVLLALLSCGPAHVEPPPGVLTVQQEQQGSWVRNFNPYAVPGAARWPTTGGIYEPLAIYNSAQGEWVPWLATGWRWTDPLTFEVDIRTDAHWSDGNKLTAEDVLHSFTLIREHSALDLRGLWKRLETVEREDDTVIFRLTEPRATLSEGVLLHAITPAHVWSTVDDPVSFTNPDPVASGPFTEVKRFSTQIFELSRNPHGWHDMEDGPTTLRFPALSSNDQVLLALVQGELDWSGSFVPAVEQTYLRRDPEHHHHWFPAHGGMVFLYPGTTKAPLDDPKVRKALSLAIDRERLVDMAMYGYTDPAHASGLSDVLARWRAPRTAPWIAHDPDAARALLTEAGLTWDGSTWLHEGKPLTLQVNAVAGWSDWVRAAQLIVGDLQDLGIDASLRTADFGAWFERVQRGEFDLTVGWSVEGTTPHGYWRDLLGSETVKPMGESAPSNWHRFADPSADPLLDSLVVTTDEAEQRALSHQLQARFVETAPAIPLFANPAWGTYNTRRFTGWPNEDDPHATLTPNKMPETLLVLTRLHQR